MGKIIKFVKPIQENTEDEILEIVRTISVKEVINKTTGEILVESLSGVTERYLSPSEFNAISEITLHSEEEVKNYTSKFSDIFKNIFSNL